MSSNLSGQTEKASVLSTVMIRGNTITKDYVILREMTLQPGDTITPRALEHDKNQIYNLGLFNRVDLTYSQDTLYVDVVERWYFFPFPVVGFQYNDFQKLYYGFGVMHNNLRGRNEKLLFTIGWGYDRWITLEYNAPYLTQHNDYFVSLLITLQKTHNLSVLGGEYENDNMSVRCSLGKRWGLYHRFNVTGGYDVWEVNEPLAGRTLSMKGRDAFPVLGIHYRYDTRNNKEYTTSGTLVKGTITKYGSRSFLVDLVCYEYDIRHFYPIVREGGVGFRSTASILSGGISPPYLRMFFGFSERIRGHYFRKYEGERRFLVSSEIRFPMLTPRHISFPVFGMSQFTQMRYGVYWVFFGDAGKIWYRTQRITQQPILAGVGCGFHVLLPYAVCVRLEGAINEHHQSELYFAWDVSF
ncbi:MAG: hypothetical protein N3A63_07820 [Bacteroidetes bacterium]|nr:hypothetical protein [Bacteroidota bacterium]